MNGTSFLPFNLKSQVIQYRIDSILSVLIYSQ